MHNFIQVSNWNHHRHGWGYVLDNLKSNIIATIPVVDWIEGAIKKDCLPSGFWFGFSHNVIDYPNNSKKYSTAIPSLRSIFSENNASLQSKLSNCRHLITFSEHTANFIRSHGLTTTSVKHPIQFNVPKFSIEKYNKNNNKKISMVGQWMRDHSSLSNLRSNEHVISYVNCPGVECNRDVESIPNMKNSDYDKFMCENVIFLKMHDVSACNTILECIARNTPVIVNRTPAVTEYLGKDYPLLYNSIEEANKLINFDKIRDGHIYLSSMDKSQFTIQEFILKVNSVFYNKIFL